MPNIARLSIQRPLYPWILLLACLVGGLYGIDNVGRLEDPPFPLKIALIITPYPGASAEEVEHEVTDIIEASLQELAQVDELTSKSVPGRSEIQVQIQEEYDSNEVQQIFDELRRRVQEAALRLPPGAGQPIVEDDFGDVFGIMYAVETPGYTPAEIHDISRRIATELKNVEHVAKVQTVGEPDEAIYVELPHQRRVSLGLSIDSLFSNIGVENQVLSAGSVTVNNRRLRIAPALPFDSLTAVRDMRIGQPGTTEILRLGDIAEVSREATEVPNQIIRHGGKPVFTVGVSVVRGENVVEVGQEVDARLQQVLSTLPLGVNAKPIYAQHLVVDVAIQTFLRNLGLSVATVVLALCIFMGWRAGTVVGAVLLLTVLGTICLMTMFSIPLQRISLGALMIAMGMLVDNGIVVAEGMLMGVRTGFTPAQAAARAVNRTQYPLLGATLIGILAFGPISLADDNSGHFLISLFQVVAISLLLSWVLAITIVPLLGSYLLKSEGSAENEASLYSGWAYAPYRLLIGFGLRRAWFTTLVIVAITGTCIWAFQFTKQAFFPTTNTPLFYVDYRLPEGTDILATSNDTLELETLIEEQVGVVTTTSFIGRGALRFTAIMHPEQPNSAYAQIVVRVEDVREMDRIMADTSHILSAVRPDAEIQISRAAFTPSGNAKIEVRFLGPDAAVLRALADQALAVFLEHDLIDRHTDWRQPALQLVPNFNEVQARIAGVSRQNVAQTLAYSSLGVPIGLYRDADKLIPIIARAPERERADISGLSDRLVWSNTQQQHVPLSQVVPSFDMVAVNNNVLRRERIRTIQARANPPLGHNPTRTLQKIEADVEAIALPPGYRLEWGGEIEANQEANETLGTKIPIAMGIMLLITILMFGQLKQPIVIWLTVPMTICGVVIGLLVTDMSFTFPSFLGFLSLSGMLLKNCIVLVDEIDKRLAEGEATLETMMQASVSRLRPVLLAAGTTIAGMSPLLSDAFFREMAVCIMSGLAFATLLTLVAVPVFYRIALGKAVTN